jgi:hypothetical protein
MRNCSVSAADRSLLRVLVFMVDASKIIEVTEFRLEA